MNRTKATYIKRVIEVSAKGRYPRSTERCVAGWLTRDEDASEKERVLSELWDEAMVEEPGFDDADCAYNRWVGKNAVGPTRRGRRRRSGWMYYIWQGVAASLLIALGAAGVMIGSRSPVSGTLVQVNSLPGEIRTFTLSDGTEVMLNGRSSIVYPDRFTGGSREVVLIGEADFKVAKDARHPFIVKSGDVSVTALGTEFNVSAYPHHDRVVSTLIEGKVQVVCGTDSMQFILEPNEQLVYDKRTQTAAVTHPPIDDIMAWQRGEIVFVNATLPVILKDLETVCSYKFHYNDTELPDDRYTFRFYKDMSLREMMDVISGVAGEICASVDGESCTIRRKCGSK